MHAFHLKYVPACLEMKNNIPERHQTHTRLCHNSKIYSSRYRRQGRGEPLQIEMEMRGGMALAALATQNIPASSQANIYVAMLDASGNCATCMGGGMGSLGMAILMWHPLAILT